MVDRKTVADHLRLVVVPLDQPRAILVADSFALGRIELDVVVVAGLDAHPPPREPALDLLVGHVQEQDGRDPAGQLAELIVQRPGLVDGARESIEDESVAGVLLL